MSRRVLMSPMLLGTGAAMLALSLGCEPARIFLEAPQVSGARAHLFAFEQEPNLELWAMAADAIDLGFDAPDWFEPSDALGVTRFALAEPLDELGLGPGQVPPSPPPRRPIRALSPLGVHVASLQPSQVHERLVPGTATDRVLDFELPQLVDCPRFEYATPESVGIPIEALSLDDSTVIALSLSEILLFHVDGRVVHWPLPADETGAALCLSDLGRPWVATSSAVLRFDSELGFIEASRVPHDLSSPAVGLKVDEGDGTPEALLLSRDAELLRYTADTVGRALVHPLPREFVRVGELGSFSSTSARFVRLGAQDFLLVGEDIGLVLEYRGGEFRSLLADGRNRGFGGALIRPDGTVVLAETLSGTFYLYDRGAIDPVGGGVTEVASLASRGSEQIVFVTLLGIAGVAHLDDRSCANDPSAEWRVFRTMARLGDAYLVGGDHSMALGSFGRLHLR